MSGWGQQLAGIAAVVGWLALTLCLALLVRLRWADRGEWSRKVVHIGSGPVVLIAWAFGIHRWIAIPAAAAVTVLAVINHRTRVLPGIEDVGRRSYGTIAYGASITLLLWLWWPAHAGAVSAGVLVMAVGDGLAGLLGPLIPSPSWDVLGERRSLVGTFAMAVGTLLVLSALRAFVPGSPEPAAILAIAAFAVLLEQVALAGIDNLSVPIAVAGLWRLLAVP